MTDRENQVVIVDPNTGASEKRRLLSAEEVSFSIRMAMMKMPWHGTPRSARDAIKRTAEAAVLEQFRLSGYRVYGSVPWNGPIGSPRNDGKPKS